MSEGTVCPKDFMSCPDDMCRGCGICAVTGSELLSRCAHCSQVYSVDVDCACVDEVFNDEFVHDCGEDTCVCEDKES